MTTRTLARTLAAAASTLAIAAVAGAALAQEDEEEAPAPAASSAPCGVSFAQSGAASNVAYAALQLTACDALLSEAGTVAELNAAIAKIDAGHEELIARWEDLGEQLLAAASDPTAPVPPPAPGVPRTVLPVAPAPAVAPAAPAEGEEAAPAAAEPAVPAATAADTWTTGLADRHAVEVASDGLRLMARLAYRLTETYADPAALAAGLQGPAAAQVGAVLAERQVCVNAGDPVRGNTPATGPSWYAFAEIPQEAQSPINYEREIGDEVAEMGATYLMTGLASAPSLGVTTLTSFTLKSECSRPRDWPSNRDPA